MRSTASCSTADVRVLDSRLGAHAEHTPSLVNVMRSNNRLWRWLGLHLRAVVRGAGLSGPADLSDGARRSRRQSPASNGDVMFTGEQVQRGQQVWQSAGGQQLGSIWGHGSYVAPDWSADWLHREALALRRHRHARATAGARRARAPADQRARSMRACVNEMRAQHLRRAPAALITVSIDRAQAIRERGGHYEALFGNDPRRSTLREQYRHDARHAARPRTTARRSPPSSSGQPGRPPPTGPGETDLTLHQQLAARAAGRQHADRRRWSCGPVVSIILLLAGIGGMVWYHAPPARRGADALPPKTDPLLGVRATPSMRATAQVFLSS